MTEALYGIMRIIANIHNYIMHLNDKFEYDFSDKDMHFLVIGALGMLMIFVVYPFFKWLASKKHIMVIAWIYVFTLILVITFAIEIGQKISNTGNMEFADIVFGVMGFIVMFAIFAVIRGIYHGIKWLIAHRFVKKDSEKQENMDEKKIYNNGEMNGEIHENPYKEKLNVDNKIDRVNSKNDESDKVDLKNSEADTISAINKVMENMNEQTKEDVADDVRESFIVPISQHDKNEWKIKTDKVQNEETVINNTIKSEEYNSSYRNYEYKFSNDDIQIIADLSAEEEKRLTDEDDINGKAEKEKSKIDR